MNVTVKKEYWTLKHLVTVVKIKNFYKGKNKVPYPS